jgi:predicted DNA-binding transcriptional regulator YafY
MPSCIFPNIFTINTYILERTFHKNQTCKQNKDGTVYLSFKSNQIQETLYWILSLADAVPILNPPELNELYKENVKRMMKKTKEASY